MRSEWNLNCKVFLCVYTVRGWDATKRLQCFINDCESFTLQFRKGFILMKYNYESETSGFLSVVYENSYLLGYDIEHLKTSWMKRDQLDVTCFFISLFNAQHVSDVNTSIIRNMRVICWVISCVVLLSYQNNTTHEITQQISRKLLRIDVLTSETCWALSKEMKKASDIKLVSLYSTIKMMHGPINRRS